MIIKNNYNPIITYDGVTILYGRVIIDNKTTISNEFLNSLFVNSPNLDEIKISLFYTEEPFNLKINNDHIFITGKNDKEILLGIINLLSLKQTSMIIPNQIIQDRPKTNHREFMLDIARNIVSLKEIKKIIDEMFHNRINYLHLHFSDDENYAIESKIHPELNTKAYLTQAEIKELIDYAQKRGIEIIPEFDMPGHLNHLLEVKSNLRCNPKSGNSLCFAKNHDYLYELIDEICDLFPGEYYHLGGDELGIKNQCNCSECQKLISENHLKSPKELAANFINELACYIQNKGKKVIVWNDALRYGKINEDIIIQKWFNYPFDKTCLEEYKKGRKVIISSATDTYLGVPFSLTPLKKIYHYVPEINDNIVVKPFGVSSHLWTELISENDEIERAIFPSLQAFGENAWLNYDKLDYKDFLFRVREELEELQKTGINYSSLDLVDRFSLKEIIEFLNKKLRFKNYTDFSTIALIKMISEYHFNRKSNKLVKKYK